MSELSEASELSDRDWVLVNGYHDGELSGSERAAFEARLAREPALAEALSAMRDLSAGLEPLRRQMQAQRRGLNVSGLNVTGGDVSGRRWPVFALGSLAAGLAAVVLVLALMRPGELEPVAVHEAFVAQSFAVDESQFAPVMASASMTRPDLGSARLALVSSREIPGGSAAHYAGINNCRLTFFATDAPLALRAGARLRSASWQAGRRHYAVVANGMDMARFQAIAAYLEQTTRARAGDDSRLALLDVTRRASSCSR